MNNKILILEKEPETTEVLARFFEAMGIEYEVTYTHANTVRVYSAGSVGLIFMNPELAAVDIRAVISDLEGVSHASHLKRPPIIFLYSDPGSIAKHSLDQITKSKSMPKPITMEQIYRIADTLGILKNATRSDLTEQREKIREFDAFLEKSDAWLTKLKSHLVK